MNLRVALVVPHIFMQRDILPHTIFSPGQLALNLADSMQAKGISVTLFSPGPVDTQASNVTANLDTFNQVLAEQKCTYMEFLKKSPLAFISMSRQIQNELLADAYHRANNGEFDVVHVYTNEEEQGLSFAKLCNKPVIFTHHDPFNLSTKYRTIMPKYADLPWLSLSNAQRKSMPIKANWIDTIYHGIKASDFIASYEPNKRYVAYLGRIIKNKGVHLAIQAVLAYNKQNSDHPLTLKIAGKHYSGYKDIYWQKHIEPYLTDKYIEYVGFVKNNQEKQEFLGNASALLVPSLFEEPFGMVMIEALACGTPIIGLDSGAIPEIVTTKTGMVIDSAEDEATLIHKLSYALGTINTYDRQACREDFENRFTLDIMAANHIAAYEKLIKQIIK